MKVKELIERLKKYDPECRVLLYSHGTCGTEEEDEIIFASEGYIYNDKDEVIETVVELYDY